MSPQLKTKNQKWEPLWEDRKIRFMISYELTYKTFITHVQRLQSQDLLLYGVLARNKKMEADKKRMKQN